MYKIKKWKQILNKVEKMFYLILFVPKFYVFS